MRISDGLGRVMVHGSKVDPIVVRGVPAEYAYMFHTIGPYTRKMQALLDVDGKNLDLLQVVDQGGRLHEFYFDYDG
jgi:hypothetical protein